MAKLLGIFPISYFIRSLLINSPGMLQCVLEFGHVLVGLGIYVLAKHVKQFVNILQPLHDKSTVRNVIELLPPQFSEEGTNKFLFEKQVYNKFIKYAWENAAGCQITMLEDILMIMICTDELPVLSYKLRIHVFAHDIYFYLYFSKQKNKKNILISTQRQILVQIFLFTMPNNVFGF